MRPVHTDSQAEHRRLKSMCENVFHADYLLGDKVQGFIHLYIKRGIRDRNLINAFYIKYLENTKPFANE